MPQNRDLSNHYQEMIETRQASAVMFSNSQYSINNKKNYKKHQI